MAGVVEIQIDSVTGKPRIVDDGSGSARAFAPFAATWAAGSSRPKEKAFMARVALDNSNPNFALAHPIDPQQVAVLCSDWSMNEDGSVSFSVINGAWKGTFDGESLYVHETKVTHPAVLVWQGKEPHWDYNEAIRLIEEEIKQPVS